MTSYCDHWVANQLDMRTPHYDSDESGSELSGSWLDISKDEQVEDDDRLSSTASALGSSTISNISTSEVSSDTEGFSLSSDESQPDLDDDRDHDHDEDDAESDRDEDKTPAASFSKFTSSFIFPDPANSFSTIGETPVPSIYNVPSEPMWQGIKEQPSSDTASTPSPSNSTAELTGDKQPATDHPFQARSSTTPSSTINKRRSLTAIASVVALSLLIKIAPVVFQHNFGALVANTFSAPGPLDAVPTYTPPAAAKTPARASDESIIVRALSALSEQPTEPTRLKAHSKTTSHHKGKAQAAFVPTDATGSGSLPEENTSLSVLLKSELGVVSTSTSLFIKHAIEEHFTDPVTTLTKNARNQVGNLTVWSYELLVVLSRVTVDFLAREIHLAHSEISQELSRIRAAAETLYSRRGELADQVSSAASNSAGHVRHAALVSAKQAQEAASFSLQQANNAALYSGRKARQAYAYLHRVANRGNRQAARGARRMVRGVTQSQSSMLKAGTKGAQKAKSQLGDSLAAGAQLASKAGKQAARGASKGAKNVKHQPPSDSKKRCGAKSKFKGCGSKKSTKSKWGRRSNNAPARQCTDGRKSFWKRIRR